jgi:hypothetical protein
VIDYRGHNRRDVTTYSATEVNLQQKIVLVNKNFLTLNETINNLYNYIIIVIKSVLFTFSEMPSIGLFLYDIKMSCPFVSLK